MKSDCLKNDLLSSSVFIPFWDFPRFSMGFWSNLILFAVFSQYSMEMKAKSHTIYEFFPI